MTADAVIRLTRAHEALRAAELLQAEGFHADSVNRAHLSLELAARAALSLHGVTSRTHTGIQALFYEHLAKPGLLPVSLAQGLAAALRDRLASDYEQPGRAITSDRAARHIDQARAMIAAVEALLTPIAAPGRTRAAAPPTVFPRSRRRPRGRGGRWVG